MGFIGIYPYPASIYKLFSQDEIWVGFPNVVAVNKNISHLFVPCKRKRKCLIIAVRGRLYTIKT